MGKKLNLAAAFTALFVTVAAALVPTLIQLDNNGNIHVPNPNLAVSTATLNWGSKILPGSEVKRTVNFTNTGDAATQPLMMSTQGLTVGTLRWNLEGKILQPNQIATATFTLTVNADAADGDFSFSIVVTG